MTSDSATPRVNRAASPVADHDPPTAAQKGAATVLRNKARDRAESLADMRAQIADGSLVVRQMTAAEQGTASHARPGRGHPTLSERLIDPEQA